MSNTALIQARIEPDLKNDVEVILGSNGLDIPTAIRIFFAKIRQVGGIPFEVRSDAAEAEATLEQAGGASAGAAGMAAGEVSYMVLHPMVEAETEGEPGEELAGADIVGESETAGATATASEVAAAVEPIALAAETNAPQQPIAPANFEAIAEEDFCIGEESLLTSYTSFDDMLASLDPVA